MRWQTVVGIILIAVGVFGILWGAIPLGKKEHEVEAGPLRMEVEERETLPVHPVLGGVALVAGIALVYVGRSRRRAE